MGGGVHRAVGRLQAHEGHRGHVHAGGDLEAFQAEGLRHVGAGVHQGTQVVGVELPLAVGQILEAPEQVLHLVVGNVLVAQVGQGLAEGGAATVLAHHQHGGLAAHQFGVHDLVGFAGLDHAVLVNAGLVREGVVAHDGLVGLHRHPAEAADQAAGAVNFAAANAGLEGVVVAAGVEGHHDLFQAGVPGPFPDTVDGAFDLPRPALHRGDGVGDRHAQVVVAVARQVHVIGQFCFQEGEQVAHLVRGGVTHGVRHVDGRGPGLHRRPENPAQERPVAAGGVLGAEFHVVHEGAGQFHGHHGAFHHRVRLQLQLLRHVNRAGRNEGVDARLRGGLHGLRGGLDVGLVGAGQASDDRATHFAGNAGHALQIAGAGNGETGLDHVHAQPRQGVRDLQFLSVVQRHAGRLLTVTQGRVENADALGFNFGLGFGLGHVAVPPELNQTRKTPKDSGSSGDWGTGLLSRSLHRRTTKKKQAENEHEVSVRVEKISSVTVV